VAGPIDDAAAAAMRGELVVLPTDTVYGLGTRPDDAAATDRLFAAKGRPRELELPVLVPTPSSARAIAEVDGRAAALMTRFWAGPLTLVLPRTDASVGWRLGGDERTIGVRMPHHPLALAVLARTGPLAVTSANRSGQATPPSCPDVVAVFAEAVAVYLCDERPLNGAASTVIDLSAGAPRVLRRGAIGEDQVLRALAEA
jgi:tRNA threonylcarbamoyl adenosine modification protein (Sua5/YciO/YrdC/YwlC family)